MQGNGAAGRVNGKEGLVWHMGYCFLGNTLVARTRRGLCAVAMGEDRAALMSWLTRCFPGIHKESAREEDELLNRAHAVVAGQEDNRSIPLDIQGTPFQREVWQALRTIPPGQTLSYGRLAAGIGRPGAARAVAAACGANRLAVLIPCHRVVGARSLGGYRWGVERKKALLRREGALAGDAAGSGRYS